MKTPIRRTLVGAILITILAGCAHSLVYDEARDKQAQEAKRAATELKMADTVRALEKGYAEVAKLEVESARSFAETLRNKELARVARASALREVPDPNANPPRKPLGLLNVLEVRMQMLGAKPRPDGGTNADPSSPRNCGALDCNSLRIIQATPAVLKDQQESFELSRAQFQALFRHDFRTCADVDAAMNKSKQDASLKDAFARNFAAAAQRSGALANDYYQELVTPCASIAKSRRDFDLALGDGKRGRLRQVLAQAERAESDIAAYRVKLVEAEDQLVSAVSAFSAAETKVASQQNSLRDLEERADTLKTVVEIVRKGADVTSDAGSHAAAKELVSHLETVLGAITGQPSDVQKLDANDRAAVAFVRAIPELADDADKLLKEAGRARLVPFAVAREHYRLAVKGFEDTLAIKIRRAEALRARADAMTQELAALASVHFRLTNDKRPWESQSLMQLNAAPDAKDRTRLYEALAIYWDEVFLHRSEEQMWKARAQALEYDENLARSTAAALQWDNLIGGVATVLADYHAAGIKPAEIAEFLKAFGLIYIGARVGP